MGSLWEGETWGSLASWLLAAPSGDEDRRPVTIDVSPKPVRQAGTTVSISQTRTRRKARQLAQGTLDIASRAGIPSRLWTPTQTP